MKGVQVGLLIGHKGGLLDAFPLEVLNVVVVVEETVILQDLREMPTRLAMLTGAVYCLNPEYPVIWNAALSSFRRSSWASKQTSAQQGSMGSEMNCWHIACKQMNVHHAPGRKELLFWTRLFCTLFLFFGSVVCTALVRYGQSRCRKEERIKVENLMLFWTVLIV